MRLDIVYLIWNMESRYLESEVGGLSSTGKSFRVVRACARCVCLVSSGQKSTGGGFPFSLFQREVFPFPLEYGSKEKREEKREKRRGKRSEQLTERKKE